MRPPSLPFAVLPFVLIGCGQVAPPATVYVTVTQPATRPAESPKPTAKANPVTPTTAKKAEPEKPADPWEEARAIFARMSKDESKKTESKLVKLDKQEEAFIRSEMGYSDKVTGGMLDKSDHPNGATLGQKLWNMGFSEYVASRATKTLYDEYFVETFKKLNTKPTGEEIVNGAIRFSITDIGTKIMTARMIHDGQDTRNYPETHRAATAWTGK